MDSSRKIIIASSLEPSGMTWLVNCLLELGYMCYPFKNKENVWIRNPVTGEYSLAQEFLYLKRWLPNLMSAPSFIFNAGIEFEWTHSWISRDDFEYEAILFTRDPRSSLYSRFKREASEMKYDQYIKLLHPETLLPKHQFLNLFYKSWLSHTNISIVRFEDYKQNDFKTLSNISQKIGLVDSQTKLAIACEQSTFQKASEGENVYLAETKKGMIKAQKIIRTGSTKEWQEANLSEVNDRILFYCRDSMHKLGYSAIEQENPAPILTVKNKFYADKVVDYTGLTEEFSSEYYKEFFNLKFLLLRGFQKEVYTRRESAILFYNLVKLLPGVGKKVFLSIFLFASVINYLIPKVFYKLKSKIFH